MIHDELGDLFATSFVALCVFRMPVQVRSEVVWRSWLQEAYVSPKQVAVGLTDFIFIAGGVGTRYWFDGLGIVR